MIFTLYQIDAFSQTLFAGNPAAIIPLDHPLDPALMQSIAAENNLSATAFIVPSERPHHYELRWFTPTSEVDFCGHATLASAHALYHHMHHTPPFHFKTHVGELIVAYHEGLYQLDAPLYEIIPVPLTPAMRDIFPFSMSDAFMAADNLFLIFDDAENIRRANPDLARLKTLSDDGVVITAQGPQGETSYDFISRYFAPNFGIDEDPVTGSIHAALGPYWAQKLGRTQMKAYQASARGGELHLNIVPPRIEISGHAVTYMVGEISF